jgi:hypothetical protein
LVAHLLEQGHTLRATVQSSKKLPKSIRNESNISIIEASILNFSDTEMAEHVAGSEAVASCLGHILSFKGMCGKP